MKRLALSLLIVLAASAAAQARFSQAQLSEVYVAVKPNAPLPLDQSFIDLDGRARTLRAAIGNQPAVIIFADYTCATLCGPILAFAAGGLEKTGLVPGRDFHLVVIGIDPKDSLAEARTMTEARVGTRTPLAKATVVLTGTPASVHALIEAAGYHYAYDKAADQFAHPAVAYVVTGHGRISRVLSGLGLNGSDLRLALVDAGAGQVGTIVDRIRLLCYCFDPSTGVYSASIANLLLAGGVATVLALVGGIFLLTWYTRRRALT